MELANQEYQQRFALTPSEYERRWKDVHRKIYRLPDAPLTSPDSWCRFPDQVFHSELKLAFLPEGVLDFRSQFLKLKSFCRHIGESRFAYISVPSTLREPILYQFPYDVAWKTYASRGDMSLYNFHSTTDHHMFGASGRWGFYYVEAWLIYVVGVKDSKAWEALRSNFEFTGRNEQLLEGMEWVGLKATSPTRMTKSFKRNYLDEG